MVGSRGGNRGRGASLAHLGKKLQGTYRTSDRKRQLGEGKMPVNLEDLLRRAVDAGASDVHLKVGAPPCMRIDGELRRMQDIDVLKPGDTESYAHAIFTQKASNDFKSFGEADFAYGRQDLGRFRVSAFRQRGSLSLVLRHVVPGVPSLERLGLTPIVKRMAGQVRGLLIVSGSSGSGRTTSVAGIVEHINENRPVSIVTLEDPIEILFPDKMAIVAQREVGVDVSSFASGIQRATRQNTDVIMVSEIADRETAAAALAAAETGHLLVAAMHTSDPVDTVSRFIGYFPSDQQRLVRVQLAGHLIGVVSQILAESVSGTRALATEILVGTPKVQELIASGAPREDFVEMMHESAFTGMQTFDQSLFGLVQAGRVSVPQALLHARSSHEFRAKAIEAGIEA